jgi:hypothetical protein
VELPGTETTSRRFLVYGVPILAIAILAMIVLLILDIGPFADDELTRTEFIAQTDQICTQAQEKYVEAQEVPPRTTEEAADLTQRLLDISIQERDAIRELTPPEELKEPLERYLQAREKAFQFLRDATAAARDGDDAGYAEADKSLEEGAAERRRLARAVGLEVCSQSAAQ